MKEKIYLPTLTQAILIPFLTLLGLIVSHFTLIKNKFFVDGTAIVADNYVSSLASYLDNPFMNNAGVFIFWMLVGVVGYAIIAGLSMVIHAYTSNLTLDEYVRPIEGRSDKFEKFVRFILRSTALLGLIAWFVSTVWFVLPWVDIQFGEMIAYGYIPLGVMAYVVAVICFFMPIFLSRLFVLRNRVYEPELTPF